MTTSPRGGQSGSAVLFQRARHNLERGRLLGWTRAGRLRLEHVFAWRPRFGSMADGRTQSKQVDVCPHCGGELLFVEGVAHRARSVELDENGAVLAVVFADPKPVGYHRLTWLECAENCAASHSEGIERLFVEE